LTDISKTSPDSNGIVITGDITNSGEIKEWYEYQRIINKYKHPDIYASIGNHDLLNSGGYYTSQNFFCQNISTYNAFYDKWIQDYHFIFLSTESNKYSMADISDGQLMWLDAKLGENERTNKPAFVFLHQPLKDTVAGSKANQGWGGVFQDEKLREVLSKHPGAILFTGHTHWELGSKDTIYNAKYCTMVNVPSTSYLWTDNNTYKFGSQGYFIDVYPDKVVIKGRDFISREWVDSAQFTIQY